MTSQYAQCVVASWPSSNPASASSSAPEQAVASDGARGVAALQIFHLGRETAIERFAGSDQQLRHADHIGRAGFLEGGIGLDGDAIAGGEWLRAMPRPRAARSTSRPARPSTMNPQSRPADMNMSNMP